MTCTCRWGRMMQQRHGKAPDQPHTDMATNYLGYWMDNGAYYYYHTLPNTTYQVQLLFTVTIYGKAEGNESVAW